MAAPTAARSITGAAMHLKLGCVASVFDVPIYARNSHKVMSVKTILGKMFFGSFIRHQILVVVFVAAAHRQVAAFQIPFIRSAALPLLVLRCLDQHSVVLVANTRVYYDPQYGCFVLWILFPSTW